MHRRLFLGGAFMVLLLLGGAVGIFRSVHQPAEAAAQESPLTQRHQQDSAPKVSQDNSTTVTVSPPATPAASPPLYYYTAGGQITLIRYPDGSTYRCTYDSHGDKLSETGRDKKMWRYMYDERQHPVAIIGPDGQVTHL